MARHLRPKKTRKTLKISQVAIPKRGPHKDTPAPTGPKFPLPKEEKADLSESLAMAAAAMPATGRYSTIVKAALGGASAGAAISKAFKKKKGKPASTSLSKVATGK